MAERYEHLDKALCKELEKLNKKYTADVEMSETDLSRAKDLRKALYYGELYSAMKEEAELDEADGEEGYSEARRMRRMGRSYGGNSYRRGRDMRTGRYISRAIDDYGYSGHYPMEYIDPMWDRRY